MVKKGTTQPKPTTFYQEEDFVRYWYCISRIEIIMHFVLRLVTSHLKKSTAV